jgi:hypothetical protein
MSLINDNMSDKHTIGKMSRNLPVIVTACGFCGCTIYAAVSCNPRYFTTWALYLHSSTLLALVVLRSYEALSSSGRDQFVKGIHFYHLWVFCPAFCTSIAVLVTSVYLLIEAWEETYIDFCLPDPAKLNQSKACLDFSIEFVVTHVAPPILYILLIFVDKRPMKFAGVTYMQHMNKNIFLYAIHVAMSTTIPVNVYGVFFKTVDVYGDSTSGELAAIIFGVSGIITSLCCANFFIS